VKPGPVWQRYPRFAELLKGRARCGSAAAPAPRERIGRPLGDERFLAALETLTRRVLKPRRRGAKPVPAHDERQGEFSALSP
jgi:putative transposase